MMKKLVKTFGFILGIAGLSVVTATTTDVNLSDIVNKACIQRNGLEQCSTVTISPYACFSISGSNTVVPSNGRVTFTCTPSDTTENHNFSINCGNGTIMSGTAKASFTRTCDYGSNPEPVYNVSCIVDDNIPTNPACTTVLGYGFYGVCGNGVIDTGESCDLWNDPANVSGHAVEINGYLDANHTVANTYGDGYRCVNCEIVGDTGFLFEPAECLYSDSPISVTQGDLVPYWWTMYIDKTQLISEDECKSTYAQYQKTDQDEEISYLIKDDIYCNFAVYNGAHNQVGNPIYRFTEKCYNSEGELKKPIFKYFIENHDTKADGAGRKDLNIITHNHAETEFGEYKLVLEGIRYKVCNNGWQVNNSIACEVDFAVTQPYVMQVSTFGVNPQGVSAGFLSGYYAMDGSAILNKTDLNNVIKTDNDDYAIDTNITDKFNEFKNKYENLAVGVAQTTLGGAQTVWSKFGGNVTSIKKVPNKSIYFVKGNGTLVVNSGVFSDLPAYTIIVEDMNVEIVGNVLQYAMIVTNKQISFKDGGSAGKDASIMSCASGGQVVQGIYVAEQGFKAADGEPSSLKNDSVNKLWCPWGGLHVKGVLIGGNISDLMESKRSQLNSWFNINLGNVNPSNLEAIQNAAKKQRREKIIKGASLLIEYNPSLWKTLPPGAEIFTEGLEIYRR